MGGSQSTATNVANIVSNIMSTETSSIMATQTAHGDQNQGISILGGTGDVDIEDIKQGQSMNVDMTALSKALSTQVSQQKIVQQLSQSATSAVSGLSLFENSDSSNIMNDFLNVGLTVSSNLGQICEVAGKQNQSISLTNRDGNIKIKDVIQDQVQKLIGNCIQDATSSNTAVQSVQTSLDQSATAIVKGIDPLMILIAAIIGLFAFGITVTVTAGSAFKSIMKIIFPSMVVGGGVLMYLYYTSDKQDMSGVAFSSLISNDPQCAGVVSGTYDAYNTSVSAATACNVDEKCVGFDWVHGSPPSTTFYSQLNNLKDNGQCPKVIAQPNPDIKMVVDAGIIIKKLDTGAVPSDSEDGKNGDVFVDTTTGRFYWKFSKDGSTPGIWTDQGIFPDFLPGVTITAAKKGPDAAFGNDGDIYIDITDPLAWTVYVRNSGSWSTSTLTDQSPLNTTFAKNNSVPFPGRHPNVPPSDTYDWSGFKIHNRNNTYLMFGLVLIGFGIIGTIGLFTSSSTPTQSQSPYSPYSNSNYNPNSNPYTNSSSGQQSNLPPPE